MRFPKKDQEILNILAKIKLLKTKENDKDEKFADNSNTIVSAFMGENKVGIKKDSDLLLGKRAEMEAKVC